MGAQSKAPAHTAAQAPRALNPSSVSPPGLGLLPPRVSAPIAEKGLRALLPCGPHRPFPVGLSSQAPASGSRCEQLWEQGIP